MAEILHAVFPLALFFAGPVIVGTIVWVLSGLEPGRRYEERRRAERDRDRDLYLDHTSQGR